MAVLLVTLVVVSIARPAGAQELPVTPHVPNDWVVYGGISEQIDFAPVGGVWFGGSVSVGVRWRELIELRAEHELTFLARTAEGKPECVEPPCLSGMRGTFTPSVGPRIHLGGSKKMPFALTPSIGFALGAQLVYREPGAPIFDVETPTTWGLLAPGVTFASGLFDFRTRVRMPRGEIRSPTFELAFGAYF